MKMNRDNPALIENEIWECLKCITDKRAKIFPFGHLNNFEIDNINSIDSVILSDLIPEFDLCSDALNTNNNLNSSDIDENMVHNINSKYYSCQDFYDISYKANSTLNIFHTNVNGYSSHVDTINDFLAQSKVEFDAICVSETSLQHNDLIPDNDILNNYSRPFTTNTMTSKGGVAIFLKNGLDAHERHDLKICTKEFESVWIEINNKKIKKCCY